MSYSEQKLMLLAVELGATIHRDLIEQVATIKIGRRKQRFWMDNWQTALEWLREQQPVKRGGRRARRRAGTNR